MSVRMLMTVIAIVCVASATRAAPLFVPLGDLPGGAFSSRATAVSGDGTTVVGTGTSASGTEAFLWRVGQGMQPLGDLPGGTFASSADDVSADGTVVVGASQGPSGSQAFRWTEVGGLEPLGGGTTRATAITRDGTTIVGQGGPSSTSGVFRWTSGGGVEALAAGDESDVPGDFATDVSDNGSVVVGYASNFTSCPLSDGALYCGWRWQSSTGFLHDDLPGVGRVHATSASGSVVVGTGTTRFPDDERAIWFRIGLGGTGGTLPDHFSSEALDVTASGQFAVGYSTDFAETAAFLFHPDLGFVDLQELLESQGVDLTGWTLTHATGIADHGLAVVGYGINPSGQQEAWFAIIPEPSTLLLLTSGLIALAAPRGRRD